MAAFRSQISWALVTATLSLSAAANQDGGPTAESCRIVGTLARLPGLAETSGVAFSRRTAGVLWTVIDSGPPMLYALDAARGTFVGRVQVTGADVQDWEDVSVGSCPKGSCLYIADIGDNSAHRDHVTIYRVAEPDAKARSTEAVEVFQASYPDGPHDAEALFVSPQGQLFIVTKGDGAPIALYRLPADLRAGVRARLERVGPLPMARTDGNRTRVTDAETSPDGRWVAVRTHETVLFYRTAELIAGPSRETFRADVSALREPQGEGVAMSSAGDVYLVGESAAVGTFARLSCTFGR